jgi:hypothetical protein
MIGTERTHKVKVWSREVDIAVYHQYETVWIASGDYMVERSSAGPDQRCGHWQLDRGGPPQGDVLTMIGDELGFKDVKTWARTMRF